MNKKTKEVTYLSPEEIISILEQKKIQLGKLQEKMNEISQKYLSKGNKEKVNYRQLGRLNKKKSRLQSKIQHLRNEILKLSSEEKIQRESIIQKIKRKFAETPYKKQKQIFGIILVVPWVIGALLFFVVPMISTVWWSLNDMSPEQGGGFSFSFIGLKNYLSLFTSETLAGSTVLEVLTSSVLDILINLPTIIIFSVFIAVLLNKKFKGHQLVKAIFFIPVVYNLSVVNNTLSGAFGQFLGSGVDEGFQLSESFNAFLMNIGIGGGLVGFLMDAVDRIFQIVNKSGIQIIMFLAALQSIPNHLYESAKVEGATKYEMFWKVTIPMVSPMILTALVYTIVDSFGSSEIMSFLTVNSQGTTMATNQPGLYSAISILYFLINIVIIVFAFVFLRKKVFYYD